MMSKLLGAGASHPPLSSRPELAEQWHPTKNKVTTPASVSLGSGLRAWWLCMACSCGHHEWQTSVRKRALKNSACPLCAGKRPCRCNSLAALRPALTAQWHQAGNGELKPEGVLVHSNKKVQWAYHQHSPLFTWAALIKSRTRAHKPSGCPQCARGARGPRQGKQSSPFTCAVTTGSSQGEEHYHQHAGAPSAQGARRSVRQMGNRSCCQRGNTIEQ